MLGGRRLRAAAARHCQLISLDFLVFLQCHIISPCRLGFLLSNIRANVHCGLMVMVFGLCKLVRSFAPGAPFQGIIGPKDEGYDAVRSRGSPQRFCCRSNHTCGATGGLYRLLHVAGNLAHLTREGKGTEHITHIVGHTCRASSSLFSSFPN